METIEVTGETIEKAIEAGLQQLGVGPDDVMVEVIEEPNRGLLGIGARPARIRLILMGGRRVESTPTPASNPQVSEQVPAQDEQPAPPAPDDNRRSRSRTMKVSPRSGRSRGIERGPRKREDTFDPPAPDEIPDEEADEIAQVGKQVLSEILQYMGFEAQVGIRRAEATRQGEEDHWILNISGKNTSDLVGRRGETLSALQYLARLIVSRKVQRRANIIVDVAQYKERRSDRLRDLANRMADRALTQGRMVTLEPMPPHERRIIHLSLRARTDVVTRSVGEGKSRKVTIAPAE